MCKLILNLFILMFFVGCVNHNIKSNNPAENIAISSENAIEVQMLMPEEQQKIAGFDRQRKMYPKDAQIQLSFEACQKGFKLLFLNSSPQERKKNLDLALTEFNRAWRFYPDQYAAWWGAGIEQGERAKIAKNSADMEFYIKNSVILLEKALKLAPDTSSAKLFSDIVKWKIDSETEKADISSDLVQSYSIYGGYLCSFNRKEMGAQFLQKGKALIDSLIKKYPCNGKFYNSLAINAFYRQDIKEAQIALKKAELYNFPVAKSLKNDIDKATK